MIKLKWSKDKNNKKELATSFAELAEAKKKDFSKIIKLSINKEKEKTNDKIHFEDDMITISNDEKIFKCTYMDMGIYDEKIKMWYWAWFVPFKNRKLNPQIHINNFNKYIQKNYDQFHPIEADIYHFYTTASHFYYNKNEISKLTNMILAISDYLGFIEITKDNLTEYILIKNIVKITSKTS